MPGWLWVGVLLFLGHVLILAAVVMSVRRPDRDDDDSQIKPWP